MLYNPPTLGIPGGGQLARMTAIAAFQRMKVHIMENHANSPAGQIAHRELWPIIRITLPYSILPATVMSSRWKVSLLRTNLMVIERAGFILYPRAGSVAKIQDKLIQKQTFDDAGIPVAAFSAVANYQEAEDFGKKFGYPFVLKSRRNGYDGYGNATIRKPDDIPNGWEKITQGNPNRELYCEAFIPFVKELAVMVARGANGESALYPVVETVQENHICGTVIAPASVGEPATILARDYALHVVEVIQGVGIFGVELFVTGVLAGNFPDVWLVSEKW